MTGFFPIGGDALGGDGAVASPGAGSATGSLSQTLGEITAPGAGVVLSPRSGSLSQTLGGVTTAAAGTVTPPSVSPDANWSSVTLLMHADNLKDVVSGANASAVGSAGVDTGVKQFGSGSIAIPAGANYLTFPDDSKWDLGTGDFTIEAWFYANGSGNAANRAIIGQFGAGKWWGLLTDSAGKFYFSYNDGATEHDSNKTVVAVTAGAWHALAVTRASGALRIYLDGSRMAATANGYNWDISGSSNPLTIGSFRPTDSGWDADGYLDEIRITKGVARYVDSTYTLQTTPFGEAPTSHAGALSQTIGDIPLSATGLATAVNKGALGAALDGISVAAVGAVTPVNRGSLGVTLGNISIRPPVLANRRGSAALFIGA